MGVIDAALLAATLGLATPLLLAALGELVSERAGVLNIGLEGMMLTGAFAAFWGAERTGAPVVAILAGALAGVLVAAIVALLCIEAGAEQIVVGIGVNLAALGVTSFAFESLFSGGAQVQVPRTGPVAIPGLSDLGGVGAALFSLQPLTYVALLAVPAIAWLLYRSSWGLAVRAAGEAPEALDTSGASVRVTRWAGALCAGLGAGLGGAFLSVGQTGLFTDNMSAGRGYLALAAVIFARWSPRGVLGACLMFGLADALQLRLQASSSVPAEVWVAMAAIAAVALGALLRRVPGRPTLRPAPLVAACVVAAGAALAISAPDLRLPTQLWLALPYLAALAALAGLVGRARMPSALTIPYRREAS